MVLDFQCDNILIIVINFCSSGYQRIALDFSTMQGSTWGHSKIRGSFIV